MYDGGSLGQGMAFISPLSGDFYRKKTGLSRQVFGTRDTQKGCDGGYGPVFAPSHAENDRRGTHELPLTLE